MPITLDADLVLSDSSIECDMDSDKEEQVLQLFRQARMRGPGMQ